MNVLALVISSQLENIAVINEGIALVSWTGCVGVGEADCIAGNKIRVGVVKIKIKCNYL